jgi:hypothetical protein
MTRVVHSTAGVPGGISRTTSNSVKGLEAKQQVASSGRMDITKASPTYSPPCASGDRTIIMLRTLCIPDPVTPFAVNSVYSNLYLLLASFCQSCFVFLCIHVFCGWHSVNESSNSFATTSHSSWKVILNASASSSRITWVLGIARMQTWLRR